MIPTPHVIGVRRWGPTGNTDAHGVEEWAHGDPEPVPVHAVGPRVGGGDREPDDPGPRRWLVIDGLTVYAPAGTRVSPDDRILWPTWLDPDGQLITRDAIEYEVDGPVADWTHGPWHNPAAGVTFELEKVNG